MENDDEINKITSSLDRAYSNTPCLRGENNESSFQESSNSSKEINLNNVDMDLHQDTPLNLLNNVCIDYLTIRFNETFSTISELYIGLAEILGYDVNKFTKNKKSFNNYKNTIVYGESMLISYGGENTKLVDGTATSILELTGDGCREFEGNGKYGWIDLLKYIIEYKGICKRIDLAYDDYNNTIPLIDLYRKISDREYITSFLAKPVIRTGRGFSATFGSQSGNKQLCIYDKKSEREVRKHIEINSDNWVRYESRFMKDLAEDVMLHTYDAMIQDSFGKYVTGLLNGLLTLKIDRCKKYARRDLKNLKDYEPWVKLICPTYKIIPTRQDKIETTLQRKIQWLDTSTVLTELLMFIAFPDEYESLKGNMFLSKRMKLNEEHISIVNKELKKRGIPEITLEEAISKIEERFGKFEDKKIETLEHVGIIDENGVYLNKGIK